MLRSVHHSIEEWVAYRSAEDVFLMYQRLGSCSVFYFNADMENFSLFIVPTNPLRIKVLRHN
jgi:hypothetical protein